MKQLATILLLFYCLYVSAGKAREQNLAATPAIGKTDPRAMIKEGQLLLKEGDLVVRLSRDPASRFIKNFNPHDKSYSHSGIVLYENGYPYIFHIVNGDENPGERLRKDSLGRFCDPRKNAAYGIFRYEMNDGEIKKLKDAIYKWYRQGIRFDGSFDLASDDRMYCSEMVSKALAEATGKRIVVETTGMTAEQAAIFSACMHLPFAYTSKLQLISIDGLYTNPFCHVIKKFTY